MFDRLDIQGHSKVMANFDLDDLMALKASIFYFAIQRLPCIPIATISHRCSQFQFFGKKLSQ